MSEEAARAALSRMNGREVAVAPMYTALAADLRAMALADPVVEQNKLAARRTELCVAYGLDVGPQTKPFAFAAGLAIIPITGTLINRFSSSWGSVTGYNFIRSQVMAACMDADVKGIVYDINSYGGEAAGCFECVADIKLLTEQAGKPTLAVIDSNCYSAAMALATAADRRVSIPSGGIGSVGVLLMHINIGKALADFGVEVTFVMAGDHKADGNPFESLPKEVRSDMQKNIDKTYDTFIALVATNLGVEEKVVRDTQARCYRADDALAIGFIDAIESPGVAVRGFFGALSGASLLTSQEPIMAETQSKPDAAAEQAAAVQQATVTATADAKKAERARISGIQSCEEAKGREALAAHLALNTEMSVEDAKGVLGASPKVEVKTTAQNQLVKAMDATGGGPKVGIDPGTESADGENTDAEVSNSIIKSYSLATGRKFKLVGAE